MSLQSYVRYIILKTDDLHINLVYTKGRKLNTKEMRYRPMYTLFPKVNYKICSIYISNYYLNVLTHNLLEKIVAIIYIICKNDNELTKFVKAPYKVFDNFNFVYNVIFKSIYSRYERMGIIDIHILNPDLYEITTSRLICRYTFEV